MSGLTLYTSGCFSSSIVVGHCPSRSSSCCVVGVTVVGRDHGRVVVVQRHGGCVVVVVVVTSGHGCIMTRGDLPV